MTKDYEEPPSIPQLVKINNDLAKKKRQLEAKNRGLEAALMVLIWSENFDGNITVKDMREFLEALKAK